MLKSQRQPKRTPRSEEIYRIVVFSTLTVLAMIHWVQALFLR